MKALLLSLLILAFPAYAEDQDGRACLSNLFEFYAHVRTVQVVEHGMRTSYPDDKTLWGYANNTCVCIVEHVDPELRNSPDIVIMHDEFLSYFTQSAKSGKRPSWNDPELQAIDAKMSKEGWAQDYIDNFVGCM